MDDTSPFGFARFMPGMDFLQTLARNTGTAMPGLPGLGSWIAPTASIEELDKRIQDLKAVQFWLEQNARGLTAMVQALEVQRMTLATLQGMNVAMGDAAAAFAGAAAGTPAPAPAPAPTPAPAPSPAPTPSAASDEGGTAAADPLQWWGALTSQFQQIAARAMQDAASHQAVFDSTREMATGALKTASDMATQWAQGVQEAGTPAAAGKKAAAKKKPAAGKAPAPAASKAAPKKAARQRRQS